MCNICLLNSSHPSFPQRSRRPRPRSSSVSELSRNSVLDRFHPVVTSSYHSPSDPFHPSPEAIKSVLLTLEAVGPIIAPNGLPLSTGSGTRFYDIGNGRIVKRGVNVPAMSEALAMEFVRTNTTIPVPTVHMAFTHETTTSDGKLEGVWGVIAMDYIVGVPVSDLDPSSSSLFPSLALQMLGYIEQLRNLGKTLYPNHQTMGSWPDGPFKNFWFQCPSRPAAEFHSFTEFHAYFINQAWDKSWFLSIPDVLQIDEYCSQNSAYGTPTLSHGDLHPQNILVNDGRIVAALDWETLGWYPSFWEYTRVIYATYYPDSWQYTIYRNIDPGLAELACDYSPVMGGVMEDWDRGNKDRGTRLCRRYSTSLGPAFS